MNFLRKLDWHFILTFFVGCPLLWAVIIGTGLTIKNHI